MFIVRHGPLHVAAAITTVACFSFILGGCADEAAPPRAPAMAILRPPPSPALAWLDHLRSDDRQWDEALRAILGSGDAAVRGEASRRLVQNARNLTSVAWRDASRERLRRANADAHVDPTPKQLEAQLDLYRDEPLLRVILAMEDVGGPEVVAYAFEVAEDEASPTNVRQAALSVLKKNLDTRDAAARARAANLWERVSARAAADAAAKPAGGAVANVVAGMAAAFRRCYNQGLVEDRDMKGSIRVTAKIGPRGEVLSVTSSSHGLSAGVVACVEARVAAAVFGPPEGGGAIVVIPVTFTVDSPAAPAPTTR